MRAAIFWMTVSFVCSLIALILQIAVLLARTESHVSEPTESTQYINTEPMENAIDEFGSFMRSLDVVNLFTPENGGMIRTPTEAVGDFMRSLEIGGGER